MEDRELIRQIQTGRKELTEQVVERYYDDIYRFCRYQTGNPEDSYDLTQETFLKFIRYLDGYRCRNLKGYLLTIAMNLCRDYFNRSERRLRANVSPEELEESGYLIKAATEAGLRERRTPQGAEGSSAASESFRVHRQGTAVTGSGSAEPEIRLTLKQALLRLSKEQREAILLFYVYGYRCREIAVMTETGLAAVKSRVRRGTEKLRELLCKEDFYG